MQVSKFCILCPTGTLVKEENYEAGAGQQNWFLDIDNDAPVQKIKIVRKAKREHDHTNHTS